MKAMRSMKAMALVSEVIFIAIAVFMVFLVYIMSSPAIGSMQSSTVFEQTKSLMLDIDGAIQGAASQGRGSRSTLFVTTGGGELALDEEHDTLKWTLQTDAKVVSPRSMTRSGNLVSGADLSAMAYENGTAGAYALENERLIVHIRKVGSASSPAYYNMSGILMGIYNKDLGMWLNMSRLEITIDGDPASMNGTGYTQLSEEGYALPRGEAAASISTSYEHARNYTVIFSLESGADFLTIEAEEF